MIPCAVLWIGPASGLEASPLAASPLVDIAWSRELADALALEFRLPRLFYVPRSLPEAVEIQRIATDYDALDSDQIRARREAQALRAAEHRLNSRAPKPETDDDEEAPERKTRRRGIRKSRG